jgi:hypothetical protein
MNPVQFYFFKILFYYFLPFMFLSFKDTLCFFLYLEMLLQLIFSDESNIWKSIFILLLNLEVEEANISETLVNISRLHAVMLP